MSTSRKRRKPKTEIGEALGASLTTYGVSQNTLATRTGVSQSYINQLVTGNKLPSGAWINLIADTVGLSNEERAALHRKAARSHGFDIDLS